MKTTCLGIAVILLAWAGSASGATCLINGYVYNPAGGGVSGVSVSANNGGTTCITPWTGYYEVTVPRGWSGRVTLSRDCYSFSPAYTDYANVTTQQTTYYFGSPASPTISGYVRTDAGVGLEGVRIRVYDIRQEAPYYPERLVVATNSAGYYSFTVPCNWSGGIQAFDDNCANYDIAPENIVQWNVTSNLTNQNFTATPIHTYLQVFVYDSTDHDQGIPGVQVTLSGGPVTGTFLTDSSGRLHLNLGWYCDGYPGGTLTVSHPCYAFQRATWTMPPDILWSYGFDIAATLQTYALTVNGANGSVTRSPDKTSYDCGETVSLSPHANSGYRFDHWSGDASGPANPLTVTMDANKTVTANFVADTCTLTVNAANGSVSRSPNKTTYTVGETVTLTPSANACYHFANWSGDASGSANPLTITMNASKTITANFAINTYTLTTNAANGSITRNPNKTTYNCGETVTLTAGANSTYHFANWSGDASGSANPLTVTMNADKTITANFALSTYSLTVNATNGSVSRSPNKTAYNHGETVSLTPTANSGYHFDHWSGDSSGSASPLTVTMNANKTITANFAIDRYTLTVSVWKGGTVVSPGIGSFTFDRGTQVTLEADALPHFAFMNWAGDVFAAENPVSVTMDRDRQISAQFVSLLDTLYVDSDAPHDPGPNDRLVSDPAEDGTPEHPFDAIREAMTLAHAGAEIVVDDGVYRHPTIDDFTGKTLTVRGAWLTDPNLPGNLVLENEGAGPVVKFGPDANGVLMGFHIQGGRADTGPAVLCDRAQATLVNCLIVGNRAAGANGGIIDCRRSNLFVVNCDISDNIGGENAAVFAVTDSNVVAANCIIRPNAPLHIAGGPGPVPTLMYCDVEGPWPGAGNIDLAPDFANRGFWRDPGTPLYRDDDVWIGPGDYHLCSKAGRWEPVSRAWMLDAQTSPCIDAGDPAATYFLEPSPNGGRINMGAYGGTSQASKSISSGN